MERKLITICVILFVGLANASAVTVYTSRSSWEAAVDFLKEEDFDDGILDPEISVVTTLPGKIQAGSGVLGPDKLWWDRLVCPDWGQTTTTWKFSKPLVGFGAYWDLAGPGGPGANIRMYLNGVLVGAEIVNSTQGAFWGVVNGPFDTILLTSGSQCGYAWCETYEMDNMVYAPFQPVKVDIKPRSCPNPLNVKNNGVIPVAILGTEDVDVLDIDSAMLEGVAPLRIAYEDTAMPFDGELCNCNTLGPDGFLDLVLHFDTQEIVDALGEVEDGDILPLTVEGFLEDGTPIIGSDCIVIRKKGE